MVESSDSNLLNEVARIIAPSAFKGHASMVAYCLKTGDPAEDAERYARDTYGPEMEAALSKASQVLVLVEGWSNSAQSQPVAMTPKSASVGSEPSAAFTPERFPVKGDRMRFLGKNGYDHELEAALKVFEPGAVVTVERCSVSSWSHSVWFEELPGRGWNGVMFERVRDTEKSSPTKPTGDTA